MAKEDFCFTYYDGDAARDMQHMDRLTRGAYNDLVIMQRKVNDGMLSLDHIKAVLGSDFEKCWFSLEIILKKVEDFFYIEWVKNSVEKMKKNAAFQSNKSEGFGRPSKQFYDFKKNIEANIENINLEIEIKNCEKSLKESLNTDKVLVNHFNHCLKFLNQIKTENKLQFNLFKPNLNQIKPLEDGNGNEDVLKNKYETDFEKIPLPAIMQNLWLNELKELYASKPASDMPVILEVINFLYEQIFKQQKSFSDFTDDEEKTILDNWGNWVSWYRLNGNGRSLETLITKFSMIQQIFVQSKNKNYGIQNSWGGNTKVSGRTDATGEGGA